ncbi:MAG: PadR family transcriptional regulator [Candidatus Woesearchaeota archaeon]
MNKRLRPLILRLLLKEAHTGYSLVKHIEENTGWKPSWGSIYPALETLEKEKIITGKTQGRSTQYTLTKKGCEQAKHEHNKSDELLTEIIKRIRILDEILDEDLSVSIAYLEELKTGTNPFLAIQDESEKMKKELYRLFEEQKITTKKKEINTILRKTNQELRKL